jgi:hypothetical protein
MVQARRKERANAERANAERGTRNAERANGLTYALGRLR